MLFHIAQSHDPADCPYGKGGSRSLIDETVEGLELRGFWLSFPEHTTFMLVETDDAARINAFLKPGASRCVAEVTPVVDQSVP